MDRRPHLRSHFRGNSMMHAILVTMGTDGDVLPYVGLGAELLARGHRVTLIAPESYQPLASQHQLEFRCLVSQTEAEELLSNPDLWHPIKSGILAARWGTRSLRRHYDLLVELSQAPDSLIVSNPGILAARLVQEKFGQAMATLLLQPGLLPSVDAPPVTPAYSLPDFSPRWARHGYWRLIDLAGDLLIGRQLNRLRRTLKLTPMSRFFRWWLSPQLVIGMFPAWYSSPQADWPSQLQLVGFPQFDGATSAKLDDDLIEFCNLTQPPIAFTMGTGTRHGTKFYRAAIEACGQLGRRGILLTRHREQLPQPLPDGIRHVPYASFQQLFPLCSAVVHHGGIGTTARAFAAGVPQVVWPLAWDQFDNAARVRKLGVGTSLGPRQRSGPQLAAALDAQMNADVQDRCRAIRSRFTESDPFPHTAMLLEEFQASSKS